MKLRGRVGIKPDCVDTFVKNLVTRHLKSFESATSASGHIFIPLQEMKKLFSKSILRAIS
jgi:hypothetical protein